MSTARHFLCRQLHRPGRSGQAEPVARSGVPRGSVYRESHHLVHSVTNQQLSRAEPATAQNAGSVT